MANSSRALHMLLGNPNPNHIYMSDYNHPHWQSVESEYHRFIEHFYLESDLWLVFVYEANTQTHNRVLMQLTSHVLFQGVALSSLLYEMKNDGKFTRWLFLIERAPLSMS